MGYFVKGQLGSFTMPLDEGPQPGSDSGWNRQITFATNRNLGSQRDTSLQMALGSHVREFILNLSRARFFTLQAMMGSVVDFKDWENDTRSVLIVGIERQSGSRPYLYETRVTLLEQ